MTGDSELNRNQFACDVGIVAALHIEISPLLARLEVKQTQAGNGLKYYDCKCEGRRIVIVEGGVGYARAKQATNALIDACQPKWILSVGLSGALVAEMNVADIVLGNAFIQGNGLNEIRQHFEYPAESEHGIHVGKLCTTNHIVHTCREKRELNQRTNAIAVDMESHAVATVCQSRSNQFMAIRAISDDLSEDLPKEVLAIFDPKGTIRTGALVGTLFKRPSSVKDLWKIREAAVRAAEKLAETTCNFIPGLIVKED